MPLNGNRISNCTYIHTHAMMQQKRHRQHKRASILISTMHTVHNEQWAYTSDNKKKRCIQYAFEFFHINQNSFYMAIVLSCDWKKYGRKKIDKITFLLVCFSICYFKHIIDCRCTHSDHEQMKALATTAATTTKTLWMFDSKNSNAGKPSQPN